MFQNGCKTVAIKVADRNPPVEQSTKTSTKYTHAHTDTWVCVCVCVCMADLFLNNLIGKEMGH